MRTTIYLSLILTVFATAAIAASYTANHDKVVAYFKSDQEKSVFDAVWTGKYYFAVGRYNVGGKQDGFAMYVCSILTEYGLTGRKYQVTIVDVVKLKQTKEWEVIGKADCA